jgi:glycosyltransferase involved in cell wall biosynthesis
MAAGRYDRGVRIAIWHGLYRGGARHAMDQLTRPLAARHDVETFILSPPDQAACVPCDVRVHCVPFSPRPHRRGGSYWNDWLAVLDLRDIQRLERRMARVLDGSGYDVVFTSTLHSGQAPGILRYLATPSAYYCHEPPRRFREPWCRPNVRSMSAAEQARHFYRRPTQRLVDEIIRRRDIEHVRCAGSILTNSRYTQGLIRAVYGRKSEVCYLGVDARVFSPSKTTVGRRDVISVGVLEDHKGFDFVIRALGKLPADRRPAFTLVGSEGYSRSAGRLVRLAERLGVRLTILSNIPVEELANLYRSHALFVFGARQEPFGLVLLEAMACGLPVAAVAEGGVPESVVHGETGLLVPRHEALFAAAVERLIGDEVLLQHCSLGAQSNASRWSWKAAGERLESALERVASRSRRSTWA